MMTPAARKAAAVVVVGLTLPVMVDAATEPYARRGPGASWLAGAAKLAPALALAWAVRELGSDQ